MRKMILGGLWALLALLPSLTGAALAAPEELVPVGHTVGIDMCLQGVMVEGFSPVETADGKCSPASKAGLLPGDVITMVNGETVESAESFQRMAEHFDEKSITVTVARGGETLQHPLVHTEILAQVLVGQQLLPGQGLLHKGFRRSHGCIISFVRV